MPPDKMLESTKNRMTNGKSSQQPDKMPKYTKDLQINGELLLQPANRRIKNKENNVEQFMPHEINRKMIIN